VASPGSTTRHRKSRWLSTRHTRRVNMSRFTSGQVRHQASLLDPLGGDHPQIRSSRNLLREPVTRRQSGGC
jgi:hypothetical protein